MAFEFRPGRFYLGMWYLAVPPRLHPPYGGNLTALVWRMADEPNGWVLQYRHRYYANLTDPAGLSPSNDRFSWYEGKMPGMPAHQVIEAMTRFCHMMGGIASEKPSVFWIRGDVERFFKLVENPKTKPYWMNISFAPAEILRPE